jgi:6-pyruvoyltetrahydropterin/6-carboxytetrahydropterin synthase
MIIDFSQLKNIVIVRVIDKLDHKVLNDIEGLSNPTAEQMVFWIAEQLRGAFDYGTLAHLRLWETDDCYASWQETYSYSRSE